MSTPSNPFILENLQEGESCKEMVMGDIPLFSNDHYNVIRQLIVEHETLTYIATRIFFNYTTIDVSKLEEQDTDRSPFEIYDVTILTKINRSVSPHLSTCDIIEKIFAFIKPSIRLH